MILVQSLNLFVGLEEVDRLKAFNRAISALLSFACIVSLIVYWLNGILPFRRMALSHRRAGPADLIGGAIL